MSGTWPDNDMSGKLGQQDREEEEGLEFMTQLLGIKLVEVQSLSKCRNCGKTKIHSISMNLEGLKSIRDSGFATFNGTNTFVHECASGIFGILDLVRFDWVEDEDD